MTRKVTDEHICLHEREFGEIVTLLDKVSKEVYGNGELGLSKTVPRLEGKVNDLVTAIASNTTVISNLVLAQAKMDGEEKGKKELEARLLIAKELGETQRRDKGQRIIWFIMALVGITGIALSIYFGAANSKKNDMVNTKVDYLQSPYLNSRGEIVFWPSMLPPDSLEVIPDSLKR